MSDREFRGKEDEKDYQKHEKEYEKEDEKSQGTWGYEKWRRDPLSSVVWAGMLIWAGLVLLGYNTGLISLRMGDTRIEPWSVVFAGAGVIVLLEVAVRLLVPAYRRAIGGTLIFAAILLGIGLGNIIGWSIVWALILIALGASVLLRGLFGGR
jgi:hypothetical protein